MYTFSGLWTSRIKYKIITNDVRKLVHVRMKGLFYLTQPYIGFTAVFVLTLFYFIYQYNKICVKWPLSEIPQIGFQYQLSLNTGQMLPLKHSAILLTVIKLIFFIWTFEMSIFELLVYTGYTVLYICFIFFGHCLWCGSWCHFNLAIILLR